MFLELFLFLMEGFSLGLLVCADSYSYKATVTSNDRFTLFITTQIEEGLPYRKSFPLCNIIMSTNPNSPLNLLASIALETDGGSPELVTQAPAVETTNTQIPDASIDLEMAAVAKTSLPFSVETSYDTDARTPDTESDDEGPLVNLWNRIRQQLHRTQDVDDHVEPLVSGSPGSHAARVAKLCAEVESNPMAPLASGPHCPLILCFAVPLALGQIRCTLS